VQPASQQQLVHGLEVAQRKRRRKQSERYREAVDVAAKRRECDINLFFDAGRKCWKVRHTEPRAATPGCAGVVSQSEVGDANLRHPGRASRATVRSRLLEEGRR